MTEQEITEAQRRYGTAKGYSEAAKLIRMSPLLPGREILTILPIHMLVGFALELHLKAWLLGSGEPSSKVRAFGHKLNDLYDAAKQHALPVDGALDELVAIFDHPHREFSFRYLDGNEDVTTVNWEFAFPVLDRLDTAVDRLVGASVSQGRQPGH